MSKSWSPWSFALAALSLSLLLAGCSDSSSDDEVEQPTANNQSGGKTDAATLACNECTALHDQCASNAEDSAGYNVHCIGEVWAPCMAASGYESDLCAAASGDFVADCLECDDPDESVQLSCQFVMGNLGGPPACVAPALPTCERCLELHDECAANAEDSAGYNTHCIGEVWAPCVAASGDIPNLCAEAQGDFVADCESCDNEDDATRIACQFVMGNLNAPPACAPPTCDDCTALHDECAANAEDSAEYNVRCIGEVWASCMAASGHVTNLCAEAQGDFVADCESCDNEDDATRISCQFVMGNLSAPPACAPPTCDQCTALHDECAANAEDSAEYNVHCIGEVWAPCLAASGDAPNLCAEATGDFVADCESCDNEDDATLISCQFVMGNLSGPPACP